MGKYGAQTERWIQAPWMSPLTKLSLVVGGAAIIALAVILYSLRETSSTKSGGLLSTEQIVLGMLFLTSVVVLFALSPVIRGARAIGLSDNGVTIVYPWRRVDLPWGDLNGIKYVAQGIVVFEAGHKGRSAPAIVVEVTRGQARAILSDPRCPQIALTDAFRRSIFE